MELWDLSAETLFFKAGESLDISSDDLCDSEPGVVESIEEVDLDVDALESGALAELSAEELYAQNIKYVARAYAAAMRAKRVNKLALSYHFKSQYIVKRGFTKIPFLRETALNKLARYYTRQGLYLKSHKAVLRACWRIYAIFLREPNIEVFNRLGGYSPVAGQLLQSQRLFNPQAFVTWVGESLRQVFTLKWFGTTKMQRRQLKQKFISRQVFVHPDARLNLGLRELHFTTEDQPRRQFDQRVFLALCDAAFKYRHGVLQKRRNVLYRRALQRFRTQGAI